MLSKITGFALNGLEGVPVEVETDINKGMVSYDLVGLPDAAVKIFLTADPKTRATRRYKELLQKGIDADPDTVLREVEAC